METSGDSDNSNNSNSNNNSSNSSNSDNNNNNIATPRSHSGSIKHYNNIRYCG